MTLPARYSAADAGTSEATWLLDERWDEVPVIDPASALDGCDRLLVLAAHPDDESLGAGGLVAAAARSGLPVRVVVATAGEGSHPGATAWGADDLRRTRTAEAREAVARLRGEHAGAVDLELLDLPDGGLAGREDEITAAISSWVTPSTLVLAPWVGDGHPDHEAVGRVAADLAAAVARVWWYPIWLWHWGTGEDLPWERLRVVPLDAQLLAAKRAGIDAHGSQVGPLGPAAGDATLLARHVRTRFERVVETYVVDDEDRDEGSRSRQVERAATFDALLAEGDPWGVATWYERRKRSLLLAALQQQRYGRVLDVGCSTGELTRELVGRADDVVAVDVSGAALARARELVPDAHVRFVLGDVPQILRDDTVTAAPFDLVVVSEVGYFLHGDELVSLLRRCRRLLAEDGELVLCHWRHPTRDVPLDGTLVQSQAEAMLDLPRRVHVEESDVILDVYGGVPPSPRAAR